MDEGARRWLAKTASKNFWRVSRWYDLEDLIQEGYFAYYYSVKKYPDATDPPNRMALFKRIFINRLHDMANKRTRDIDEICAADLFVPADRGAPQQVMEQFAAEPALETAIPALASAPKYVRDALALFSDKNALVRLRSDYRKVPNGRWMRRETLNERLCRLAGYDPSTTDIVGGIRQLLGIGETERELLVSYHQVQSRVVVERVTRAGRFVRVARVGGRVATCSEVRNGLQIDEDLWSRARAVRRVPSVAC